MTSHETPANSHPAHPVVSGKMILLGTAIGCVVLFFLTWVSLRSVEKRVHFDRTHLFWADRADWTASSVIETTLVKPNAANAQYTYNKPRYRDPKFVIPEEEESAILTCADLARSDDFASDETREILTRRGVLQHAGTSSENQPSTDPQYFYPHYLLALWHQQSNDPSAAKDYFQQAIDLAPKLLIIEYKNPKGQTLLNLNVGTVEIGCDRVIEEKTKLDQRLVLIYPNQITDAAGRIYLPVYDTTYRPVHLPQVDGYTITYDHNEGWFNIPSRLGLIHATVHPIHND